MNEKNQSKHYLGLIFLFFGVIILAIGIIRMFGDAIMTGGLFTFIGGFISFG